MIKYSLSLIVCLSIFTALHAGNEKKLSSQQFLKRARSPHNQKSWATMSGKVRSKRDGSKKMQADVYIAIEFTKVNTTGQVVLNNNEEAFTVMQAIGEPSADSTVVIPAPNNPPPSKSIIGHLGLSPSDLTMSFLFWEFVKELDEESASSLDCRVFLLKNPKKDAEEKLVKIYISKKYFFPAKAEWYKNKETEEPNRTMGELAFEEVNKNFWMITEFKIYGPGWKTIFSFDTCNADFGDNPKLFKTIKAKPAAKKPTPMLPNPTR